MTAVVGLAALPVFRFVDTAPGTGTRYSAIDGLRGFLALGVFVFHLIVTHRYQNGNLLANYHYEPKTDSLEPNRNGNRVSGKTKFMGFKDGKLIFEGVEEEMEAAKDPYIAKFVMHNG